MLLTTDIPSPRHPPPPGWDLLDNDAAELDDRQDPTPTSARGLVLPADQVAEHPRLPAGPLRRIVLTPVAATGDTDAALQTLIEAALRLRWSAEARGIEILLRADLPVTPRAAADAIETVNSPRVRWELDIRPLDAARITTGVRLLDWRLGGLLLDATDLPADLPRVLDEIEFNGFLHSPAGTPEHAAAIRAWLSPLPSDRRGN